MEYALYATAALIGLAGGYWWRWRRELRALAAYHLDRLRFRRWRRTWKAEHGGSTFFDRAEIAARNARNSQWGG